MSTIKPPKKDKKVSENWESIYGGRDEVPSSLDFSDEKNFDRKKRDGHQEHYLYTDEKGNTAFVVERRADGETGKKSFLLHSKWKNKVSGQMRWMAKKFPEPRPIYNLPKLNNSKLSRAVVVEGEKTCIALQMKMGTVPVTTYACGTYCVLKNDWKPLLDFENICLVPDHDDKGRTAMHKLAMHLVEELEVPIENIFWVLIPKDFPEGWDLADEVPKNSNTDAHTLINGAQSYAKVIENYKKIWNELKLKTVKKEVHKDREIRLRELGEHCGWIEELNEIINWETDSLVPLTHFNNNYAYLKIGSENPSTTLLKDENFNRATKFCYNPKHKKGLIEIDGITYANRYRPTTLIPKEGDITHWEEQGLLMFGEDWEVVEQYFAWCLQNLGEKVMWAMLWISEQRGIGKNWLTRILTKIYGLHNCRPNLKYRDVTGRFTDWIIGCQFAVINEIFISKTHGKKLEMSEQVKDLITEPLVHIEQKFRRSFDYENTCNFVLISNYLDCMHIDNGERRYWIKNIACQQMGSDWWKPKWKWIESGEGPRVVFHHLLKLTIKNPDLYKDRAPVTEDFTVMAKASEHPIFKWLDEHREAESGPFKRTSYFRNYNFMCVAVDLHRTLEAFKQECALDVVRDWLRRRCFKWQNNEISKQILLTNGTRPRAYIIPPLNKEGKEYWIKHLHSKTETELGLLYEAKIERPNASYPSSPNTYQEAKEGSDDAYQKAKARAIERNTHCWNCHEDISTSSDGICPECEYAIKCSNCDKCACDKPNTKIKKKHRF